MELHKEERKELVSKILREIKDSRLSVGAGLVCIQEIYAFIISQYVKPGRLDELLVELEKSTRKLVAENYTQDELDKQDDEFLKEKFK